MHKLTAGVDEVGRGPLAGDVVTAAVILDPERPIVGLADSKKLSAKRREKLFTVIVKDALSWSVGRASVAEIDRENILNATMLAMTRAVEGLSIRPVQVLVDGNRVPSWDYSSRAIIGGDGQVDCISAASIIAKVIRDREMADMDGRYPGYGFARHKGYGTVEHRRAITQLGPCPIHRRSFEPIKSMIV